MYYIFVYLARAILKGPPNGSPLCGSHSWVWPGLWVYAGCPSLPPLPTAHCLPHLCVGSALHRGTSPILSPELCCSTVTIQRRISLRSSAKAELLVPRTRTVIRQRRAFSVAGPTDWNGLPVALRLTPVTHSALFSLVLRPHCLTEVGLGALLIRFS